MNKKIKSHLDSKCYYGLMLASLISSLFNCLIAQQVLNSFEIRGGAFTSCYESMVKDKSGNYYVGFNRSTWRPAVIGDSVIYSFRNDTTNLNLADFYYVKFNKELNIVNSFVIDNAEEVKDIYSSDSVSLISMNLSRFEQEDSLYPV